MNDPSQSLLQSIREEPLAFWNVEEIGAMECLCCGSRPSHISSYPFHSSGAFARQVVLWCSRCGFGFVPRTSFPLNEYYEREYAVQNRGDRQADPAGYFARMEAADPPKHLARYLRRSRDQIGRIRQHLPKIGAMLDVGAGPGYALRVSGAEEKFAIEHDEYSHPFLSFVGAEILSWEGVGNHRYDVALLSHSLEHFEHRHVLERLGLIVSALNPGGILYIEVPTGGLGWKKYTYKHEPHTLFFTPEALFGLSRRLEVDVLSCGPLAKTYDKIEDRDGSIYSPQPNSPFGDPRGRLTLIGRKV